MEEGYETEEEALEAISSITGIAIEELKSKEPKTMLIEDILKPRWMKVYEIDDNLSFGIGYWRMGYGRSGKKVPLFGLWLLGEKGEIEFLPKDVYSPSKNYRFLSNYKQH